MNITEFDNGLNVDFIADNFAETKDPEIIKNFFSEAQTAEFLVPYKDNVNTIPLLNTEEKGRLLPIFSSYKAFLKAPLPKDKASVMEFSKIDEIVTKSTGQIFGIVINPHGKSIVFQKNQAQQQNAGSNQVKFMKPAILPEALTATLRGFFTASEKVYAAYLLLAQKENELAPKLFLLVDFDGDGKEFFPKVAEAIRPCLKNGDSLEMAKANFKLLQAAEKLVKPFYKKP